MRKKKELAFGSTLTSRLLLTSEIFAHPPACPVSLPFPGLRRRWASNLSSPIHPSPFFLVPSLQIFCCFPSRKGQGSSPTLRRKYDSWYLFCHYCKFVVNIFDNLNSGVKHEPALFIFQSLAPQTETFSLCRGSLAIV